ncbi:nucleotide sugar dehydrogenase [Bacteroides sp.]|uniref:nucleotide sugar dehydrogenase n=1 Tax=Bacteroides sp. TaxID=29523 RepID=UPI00257C4102|nr:nucleotide sugar dehydrogenase [Bacteroides sp.]
MNSVKIAVIGLGYVGLPLARLFSTKYQTVGFDMNKARVDALMAGHDSTLEVSDELLQSAIKNGFKCTADIEDIRDCNFYVVAVPTPVDEHHNPDLTPLYGASTTVGKVISKGDVVVYESTVYPGVTEEECIPVVERVSGLKLNMDFFAGYSPERINPGDKLHTVEKIKKVTSGSTIEIGKKIDEVYASVISAGTHLAPTIKVAEAAKVIENSQRDINIAFVNELSKIFTRMDIDTQDVLAAAATKWNFLPFKPGLVGGHCIGVDPYYLAQCAQNYGYNPEIILACRRMNDSMGEYVANQVVKLMLKKGIQVLGSNILIMGFTFKENCPDVRNTKVIDIFNALQEYNLNITVFDPWANPQIVDKEYGISVVNELPDSKFDSVILAVCHDAFQDIQVNTLRKDNSVLYDVKGIWDKHFVDGRL